MALVAAAEAADTAAQKWAAPAAAAGVYNNDRNVSINK